MTEILSFKSNEPMVIEVTDMKIEIEKGYSPDYCLVRLRCSPFRCIVVYLGGHRHRHPHHCYRHRYWRYRCPQLYYFH